MAGFRTFATGEVLTAANVNDFLMGQSVMRFADADARTAALGADVVEGMLTYNLATDQLEVFDGTNFVIAAPEPPAPPAGIGSNVVSVVDKVTFTSSSSSFVRVPNLDVTITPTSDTSKVLLLAQLSMSQDTELNRSIQFRFAGGNALDYTSGRDAVSSMMFFGNMRNSALPFVGMFLDSPAVDTAVTYEIQVRVIGGNNVIVNGAFAGQFPAVSSFTAIEVAA